VTEEGDSAPITVVVMEGDETGQELLEQAVRVLDPSLLGIDLVLQRFDLSLENRRASRNGIVSEAAGAMRRAGLGLKAATITPEGADDVGSPNRILREEVDGKVIVRTGRRLPGVTTIAGVHYPIAVVRMAVDDAYGAKQWREGDAGAGSELAFRTERITRATCRAVAEHAFRTAATMGARVYGGPKWTVSPVYEGMFKEEMDAAASRHPDVSYQPVLIDATYAGLLSGAADGPLVIPALNRDGDCLSDFVLPMFGSIAGAESVLLAFDDNYDTTVAMAEAPHGTAPALLGKDVANPLAMILACGAVLRHAAERAGSGDPGAGSRLSAGSGSRPSAGSGSGPSAGSGSGPNAGAGSRPNPGAIERASRAVYEAVLETVASGVKTPDLGGHAGTTEFTDAVVERVRTKLEVWSSLGSAA
jgi:3-isopropylmalate dehydrogenase